MKLSAYECWIGERSTCPTVINHISAGRAKSQYLRDLDMGGVKFTDVRSRCIGQVSASEGFIRMAEKRGISFARPGMVVEADGIRGVIVGHNDSANLDVLFTDGKRKGHVLNCHPWWKMRYFDADGSLIREYGDDCREVVSK